MLNHILCMGIKRNLISVSLWLWKLIRGHLPPACRPHLPSDEHSSWFHSTGSVDHISKCVNIPGKAVPWSRWIWTLSWVALIHVDMSYFACVLQENNPNIQCYFSQGSPNSLLWNCTTNHFEVRVTRGCNMALIYHTWYEIKPEKPRPHENFSQSEF